MVGIPSVRVLFLWAEFLWYARILCQFFLMKAVDFIKKEC